MIIIFIIILNLLAIGFFIYFVFKYKRKYKGVKHYEKIRDELTTREDEEEIITEDDTQIKSGPLANLIGGFIVILVGINLIPTVADATNEVSMIANVTGTVPTSILSLTTIFFALGIMSAGIILAMGGLRNAGMI